MKPLVLRLLVLSLFSLCVHSPARAALFTVGSDAGCTHSSLLLAVAAASANGPGLDDIHVSTNQAYNAQIIPIASQNVTIRGGYANCAGTVASGRTIIRGTTSGANGTFTTSGIAEEPFLLRLERLDLRDGGNLTARRGGAVRIEGNYQVVLSDTRVADNRAGRGGAVYIDGTQGAEVFFNENTLVTDNIAGITGGGIYCVNGGFVSITSAFITNNTAQNPGGDAGESGNGGGAALYGGCAMVQTGSVAGGVRNNSAARHGGGYYLRGSRLFLDGNALAPGTVIGNAANDTGGGIAVFDDVSRYISGASISTVGINDSWIESNRASRGGGIGLVTGGRVEMRRTLPGDTCHDANRCSSLSFNGAVQPTDSCIGAAFYAGLSSAIAVRNSFIEANCPSDTGWTTRITQNANVLVESSIVAHNGGANPFFIEAPFDGTLRIGWSTITGNLDTQHIGFFALPNTLSSTGTLSVYGTIIGEPFQQMTTVNGGGTSPMQLSFDCLMVSPSYNQSLTFIRGLIAPAPYGLVSPATGNYRPASSATSPGVDFCDASLHGRITGDADGNTAIGDAPRANVHGIFDVGAYEISAPAQPDAIFKNGFE